MSACERLSDRMPAVAAGESAWSAEESAHLAACGDCAAEWRLVVAAGELGAGIALRQAPDAMAASLLARLRALEAEDRRRRRTLAVGTWGGLALAASLLLAVLLRSPSDAPTARGDSVAVAMADASEPFTLSLPELESADTTELQAVLETFDAPLAEGTTLDRTGVDEVEAEDLERVLRAWEG